MNGSVGTGKGVKKIYGAPETKRAVEKKKNGAQERISHRKWNG